MRRFPGTLESRKASWTAECRQGTVVVEVLLVVVLPTASVVFASRHASAIVGTAETGVKVGG